MYLFVFSIQNIFQYQNQLLRLDLAHLLQIAARLLTEQAELKRNEESTEDAQATLIATQNLDAEFQQQVIQQSINIRKLKS